jgi:hypothetical protein
MTSVRFVSTVISSLLWHVVIYLLIFIKNRFILIFPQNKSDFRWTLLEHSNLLSLSG